MSQEPTDRWQIQTLPGRDHTVPSFDRAAEGLVVREVPDLVWILTEASAEGGA
jgi:hypothetical protein